MCVGAAQNKENVEFSLRGMSERGMEMAYMKATQPTQKYKWKEILPGYFPVKH